MSNDPNFGNKELESSGSVFDILSWIKGQKVVSHPTEEGFDIALQTFKNAAFRVPAYKNFLQKNKINPEKIQTPDDFKTIPPVMKENYLKQYPFKDLLWDGTTHDSRVISMSSGSSGQPFFWPRGNKSMQDSVLFLDTFFSQSFETKKKESLCIIAYAMGTWIAGTYILTGLLGLSDKGHKITTITPGINKDEIIRIIQKIGPEFEQIIILGYPPFVKDAVDTAIDQKLSLKKYNIKIVGAGENFSEKWRNYMLHRITSNNELHTISSIYGTADAGIMGMESPLSISIRRLIDKHPKLFSSLFPDTTILPTLVQYIPSIRYTEEVDGLILFTINTSLPLIRYKILDEGRVFTHGDLITKVTELGYKIPADLVQINQYPFIALYGRPDVSTIFYGLNIYPENIKYGLEVQELHNSVTGKFIITTQDDEKTLEQKLHLAIELKKDVVNTKTLHDLIAASVLKSLKANNSEYNKLHQTLKEKAEPIIKLIEFGAPEFQINVKHRWVAKT